MAVRKIEIERFSRSSSKPFARVVAALKEKTGQPGHGRVRQSSEKRENLVELERVVNAGLGRTGLMLFMELDHDSARGERSRHTETRTRPFIRGCTRRLCSVFLETTTRHLCPMTPLSFGAARPTSPSSRNGPINLAKVMLSYDDGFEVEIGAASPPAI